MSETTEGGAQGDAAATAKPGFSLGRRTAIFLISMNIVLAAALIYAVLQNAQLTRDGSGSQFSLLSSKVAMLDVSEFLQEQKTMAVSYAPMKQSLIDYRTNHNLAGRYSVYFEDLTTGAWVGLDEKDTFIPASLLKMPSVVAILKKLETGGIAMDTTVTLTPGMIDFESGTLAYNGAGYVITVRELLTYVTKDSDNTALWALNSLLTPDEYSAARAAVGLPFKSVEDDAAVSPKQYSNILRSLYLSTYLRREFSQLALSMLSETEYTNELQAGIPASVNIAHKVGFYQTGGYYHDCGIVYVLEKPYILCVMSKDSTLVEANAAISGVSSIVYEYVTSGHTAS